MNKLYKNLWGQWEKIKKKRVKGKTTETRVHYYIKCDYSLRQED